MFGKSHPTSATTAKAFAAGMMLFFAGMFSGLMAQAGGFNVFVDPPQVLQGTEPMTFSVVTNEPGGFESYEWTNGNTGEILGTTQSITLDPTFTESTPIFVEVVDSNGATGRGFSFIFLELGPPVGFPIEVDPPFVVQGNDPMTFEAVTDHPAPIVSYEWRNELTQEVLGTSQTLTLDPTFTEPTPITVTAMDDQGEQGFGSTFIAAGDNGVGGFFVLVDPPFTIQGDEPMTFTAEVPDTITPTSFEWKRLDTGEVLGTEASLTLQPNFEQIVDIEVLVTADDDSTGRGFATIFVDGGLPNLLFVEIDPPVVIQDDEPFTLTANVNDPNAVITAYKWVNDTTGEELGTEQSLTLQPTFTEPTVISCEVTDDQGETGLGCSLILPDGHNLPGFGVFIDPPVMVQEDEPMTFTAIPDQGITAQSFEWTNVNTGKVIGTTEAVTLEPNFEEVTTIAVVMTDSENRTFTAEALILVDPIGPPLLDVFVDPPLVIQENEPMTFTAQVNGPGAGLSYEWRREDTGDVIGTENSVTLDPNFEETTVISVKVTDEDENEGRGEALIIVGGTIQDPWVLIDPPFAEQGDDPMTFTAVVSDGHTAVSYAWFNENTGESLGDTQSITLQPNFEEITPIRVDVTDSEGDTESGFSLIFVNKLPTLFDLAINPPLVVQIDQPMTLTAVVPDGIDITEYVWTDVATGNTVGDAASITLDPNFETSTTIGLQATAADGSMGYAFSLVVVSQVAASFTVEVDPPLAVQGVDPLELQAIAPNGVNVTEYNWFNDHTGESLGSGQTLTITDPFNMPTLIRVEVRDDNDALGVGYALVLSFPAGPDPNGDGQNTVADLLHELPNWNAPLTVKELLMINTGHQ